MDSKKFKMDNLKKIREEKHITQVKLSTELEISQEVISHYEIGNSKPNIALTTCLEELKLLFLYEIWTKKI